MERFFLAVTRRPAAVLAAVGAIVASQAVAIAWIRFDNRPDSFLPPGHPALLAKERVEQLFGLEDPMLIAVVAEGEDGQPLPGGIFDERPLRWIQRLSSAILAHLESTYGDPGKHPVYSLATEYDVEVRGGIPEEKPFLEPFPATPQELYALEQAVRRLELYDGIIVSDDGSAGAIVVVPPPGKAEEVYRFVSRLARESAEPGLRIALAGEAAVRSAMGTAVAHSALRLNPVCVAVVVLFLYIAFRNLTGVLLPLLVVGSGSTVMLGVMSLAGIPVYIITNAILVTVMSLGVADAIHVLGEYYREIGRGEIASRRELVVRAASRLWVPVLYTSLTDVVGFFSFFVTGIMPPLRWFGLFTALGITATLAGSYTILPAALMYVDPRASSQRRLGGWGASAMARALAALGRTVLRRPGGFLLAGGGLAAAGVALALRLEVSQSMVSAFDDSSEIVQADRLINRLFHGTYFLDVLLEAEKPGELLEPAVLRRIESLERHATGLPLVKGSLSVAGFARKLNQVFNDWDPALNRIPEDAATVRLHFEQVRSSPSKHADLLRVIDPEYRIANVRLRLSSGDYRDERVVVEDIAAYLEAQFPPGSWPRASLSGRVNMDYHWVRLIVRSHVQSIAFTLAIALLCLALLFRSFSKGLLSMLPVGYAVLITYAVMGLAGIPLGIGTSMFAALAIGVGLNFPIHMLDRLRAARRRGLELEAAFGEVFSVTTKALLFNAMAVGFGFLALLASDLPLLRHFGLMIGLGIATSCITSLTVLPAVVAWLERPRRRSLTLRG
jgi:predicted RND superfamily exporter protein